VAIDTDGFRLWFISIFTSTSSLITRSSCSAGHCPVEATDPVRARTVVADFAFPELTGGAFAMGSDKPRSLPRLATPTPHVSCVLYPEHSLPISKHCEQ
jgi:hypothetical protein